MRNSAETELTLRCFRFDVIDIKSLKNKFIIDKKIRSSVSFNQR